MLISQLSVLVFANLNNLTITSCNYIALVVKVSPNKICKCRMLMRKINLYDPLLQRRTHFVKEDRVAAARPRGGDVEVVRNEENDLPERGSVEINSCSVFHSCFFLNRQREMVFF